MATPPVFEGMKFYHRRLHGKTGKQKRWRHNSQKRYEGTYEIRVGREIKDLILYYALGDPCKYRELIEKFNNFKFRVIQKIQNSWQDKTQK